MRNVVLFGVWLVVAVGVSGQEEPIVPPDRPAKAEEPFEPDIPKGDPPQGGGSMAAASSSGAGVPGGSGGSSGLAGANDILSFQTDLFTGRFAYSIPILVAPARQGAEPTLALAYNSAGGNGWCGVGWGLEVGYVERDSRKDVPVAFNGADALNKYDDAYGFIFNLGGASGKLVNVGGNEYRNEIDGTFLKFNFISQYSWEVTDKSGNKFFFGTTGDSRTENTRPGWTTNNSESTFRWALNRVLDVNGNETTLTYTTVEGFLYLSQISYNGNVNSTGIATDRTVVFTLADRTDEPLSFRSNYRVKLTKRLSSITVNVNGQRVRRYGLTYIYSPSTFRSLLSSVTQYGPTDSSTLPPVTLTYQEKPFEFHASQNWFGVNDNGGGNYTAVIRGEFNEEDDPSYTYVSLQDIDGDALPDRVMRRGSSPYDRYKVQRNTGVGFVSAFDEWGPIQSQGFTNDITWGGVERTTADEKVNLTFADINGDGYPDRIMDSVNGTQGWWALETNSGVQSVTAGFSNVFWTLAQCEGCSDDAWYQINSFVRPDDYGYVFVDLMDITGDGLPDRVLQKGNAPYSYLLTQRNRGTYFEDPRRFGTLFSQGQTNNIYWSSLSASYREEDINGQSVDVYKFVTMVDMNGDGLSDRVMRKSGTPYSHFVVQYNNGAGFADAEDVWSPIDGQSAGDISWYCPHSTHTKYSGTDTGVQCLLIDMNGDGLPDRVMRKRVAPFTDFKVQFNTGSGFTATTYDFGPIEQNSDWFWASPQYIDAIDQYQLTKVDLVDMNGDALPDRVWYVTTNLWKVQLNKRPFPDLLIRIENGIGGKVDVGYAPSTQFNNRDKSLVTGDPWVDGARALLPFVIYVVETVSTRDGFGNTNRFTYNYEGGMYDGKRREFRGFNRATTFDVYGAKKRVYFHQGGGQNRPAEGEFNDPGSVAKKGIPYRIQTVGTNGMTNSLTINKVEEMMLHTNGWCFPYISQTIQIEYEGMDSYRATAQQFVYETASGNVAKVSNLGEVANVNVEAHTFSDVTGDSIYTHTTYATLGEILNKPSVIKVTADDAGSLKLRETLYSYDTRGNLTNQQAWLSGSTYLTTTSIEYDAYGNPLRITDGVGITTQNTYDAKKMFVEEKVTGGFTNIFRYSAESGALLLAIDAAGMVSSNVYDVFFRLLESSVSTNAYGPASLWRERYAYNLGGISGNVSYNYVRKRVFDPGDTANGHETYVYVDGLGRTIQTRVEAETGQYRVSDAFYDLRGNPLFATLPHFGSGSAFTITTGTNLGAYTEYDPYGRAYKVTPAVEAVFDSLGEFLDIYGTGGDSGSPVAATVTAFSDGTNPWATVVTDPEGKVKKSYHDAYGRITNIVEVIGSSNYVTSYIYDKVGNLTNVTDHVGNKTRIVYENLGRKTAMVDPDMGTWSYVYDNASRLVQQIDAKNQKIEFVYTNDAIGRLTARKIYKADGNLAATISYVYDTNQGENAYVVPKGALFKVSDREGWTKFGYDARGRTTNTTRYLSTNQASYTTTTEYDDGNRVTTLTYPGTPTTKLKYLYDAAGNLKEIHSLAGLSTIETFYSLPVFNALGQITSVKYGTNQVINYTYHAKSKRLKTKTAAVSTNLQNLAYEYDKVSNLKKITDAARPSGTNTATITSFTYDDLHRLAQLNSGALGTRSYSYNETGNLMSNGDLGGGTYSYHRSGKSHQVSAAGGNTYTYDACGNLTNRNYQLLHYDEENRLVHFEGPSPQVLYGYDDGGTRLWKKVNGVLTIWIGGIYEVRDTKPLCHVHANGQLIATFEQGGFLAYLPQNRAVARLASTASTLERCFVWPLQDGRTPITVVVLTLLGILCVSILFRWGERRAFHRSKRSQRRGSGFQENPSFPLLPSVNNSEIPHSAFRAPRFTQVVSVWLIVALVLATTETNVHAQVYDPVFYYYHPDHLGSSNILTDRNGVIVQQYEYTAYGKERVRTSSAAFSVTHRYTGQHLDEETGLLYYQARYYDPDVGRFIQADTIVPSPTDPQSLNRYTYAGNNPYTFVDPSGHEITLAAVLIGVVVGAAVGGATAAATGGNIGMGILTGAIGGIFGGFGAWAGAAVGGAVSGTAAGIAAGTFIGSVAGSAVGGAVSAAVSGGDVGIGALTGAISGVIAFGAGKLQLKVGLDSWADDLAGFAISAGAGALGGGIGAALQGGDFWQGALYGAIGGAIGYGIAVDLPDAIRNLQSADRRFHLIFGVVLEAFEGAFDSSTRSAWFQGFGEGLADGAGGLTQSFTFGKVKGAFGSDTSSWGYKFAVRSGGVARDALMTAGGLRAGAAIGGTRLGHVLNHNRFLRIGPGRMPANGPFPAGTHVPRIAIGPQRPNPGIWRFFHFDLRIRFFDPVRR